LKKTHFILFTFQYFIIQHIRY